METVELTSNEFLSLYTGVLLANNFDSIYAVIEKVYGRYPYVPDAASCSQQFKDYIRVNNPELAQIADALGDFKKTDDRDVMQQIAEYCLEFEELYGSHYVEVDRMQYKMDGKNTSGRNI